MVFESVVADVLNRFLGDYVENLDGSQLKLGIWGGELLCYAMLWLSICQCLNALMFIVCIFFLLNSSAGKYTKAYFVA